MNRRLFAVILLIVFGALASLPAAAQEMTEAPGDTFPVTVQHKFGSTTIPSAPKRIISLGYSDQDALLALGATPIAVRYWYGDESNAIFPWAQDKVEGDMPTVLKMDFGSLNYEAILALKPDLIVAVYSGITQDEYDALSKIAPTIAQSADYIDFGMPWQETTKLIGAALGKSAQADTLVSDVEAQVEQTREDNPGFAEKTIAVAYDFSGTYGFYTGQDPRGRFFTDLGFVIPDALVEAAGQSFYANLSSERLDLLNQDVLVFVGLQFADGGREGIESDPLLSQLDVMKAGHVLFVPSDLDDALQFNTVLSIPYLLNGIVPDLQAAAGIEPVATATAEAAS
ncbi:MAG: ABC transporter substrate-binding protein [Chloroflexi bacterium]|nr:ABC transporter substrate-binding protein [Chloroflexota bacterium]